MRRARSLAMLGMPALAVQSEAVSDKCAVLNCLYRLLSEKQQAAQQHSGVSMLPVALYVVGALRMKCLCGADARPIAAGQV